MKTPPALSVKRQPRYGYFCGLVVTGPGWQAREIDYRLSLADFDEMATRLLLPGLVAQFNRPHVLAARAS